MSEKNVTGCQASALVRSMSHKDVESVILLVSRICQDASYGRDPSLCKASNLVLRKLRECLNHKDDERESPLTKSIRWKNFWKLK
ncbi:MAG: hypothetical protein M0P12_00035 [Paludibacteraceae bacterium]|nr:hypothetical protein [Paludibacteraceae bacterium]MCK9615763.1 hypothetical protein [Candidatus Omnitrophota bacterium]